MPRYFFDVTAGAYMTDNIGTQLDDLEQARRHAVAIATGLLAPNPPVRWRGQEWLIEGRDDIGLLLFSLILIARDTPIVGSVQPVKQVA